MNTHRFRKSQEGMASIEFALIAPVLLTLMLGTISSFDAYRASASLNRASTVIVDLTTRQSEMDEGVLAMLFASGEAIVGKYHNEANYFMTISSIVNVAGDEDDVLSVEWSESTNPEKVLTDQDIEDLDLPDVVEGDSMIIVSTYTEHSPLFGTSTFGALDLERVAIRRPRFVRKLVFVED